MGALGALLAPLGHSWGVFGTCKSLLNCSLQQNVCLTKTLKNLRKINDFGHSWPVLGRSRPFLNRAQPFVGRPCMRQERPGVPVDRFVSLSGVFAFALLRSRAVFGRILASLGRSVDVLGLSGPLATGRSCFWNGSVSGLEPVFSPRHG